MFCLFSLVFKFSAKIAIQKRKARFYISLSYLRQPMDEKTTLIVKKLLATPQKIVVIGHKNPDGDAVGSCLGLSIFLNSLGHSATVVMPNDFPDFLKWMPGVDGIVIYEKETQRSADFLEQADLIFTLDFNSLDRVGDLQTPLEKSTAKFVMIDHHQQPADYAVATYSDVSMSSTAEMVFHFMEAIGKAEMLSKEIATNLYTGIMTDTGSFRFPSTTPTTHRIVAKLIEAGAESATIHQNVFDTNSAARLKLLGVALNNLNILPEYNTAYIKIGRAS